MRFSFDSHLAPSHTNSSADFSAPSSPATTKPLGALLREMLSIDGGALVFRHFGFDIGKRYVSPFRPDAKHHNFSIFTDKRGHVFFKDFAAESAHSAGNFLKLLELYGYPDFPSQIRFAAALYGLHDGIHTKPFSPALLAKKRTASASESSIVESSIAESSISGSFRITSVQTAPFNDEELRVLGELSGGYITQDGLEKYGARALRRYDYEGTNKNGTPYTGTKYPRFTLVVPSANGNYYGYCYFKAATYSPFPHSAKNFHLKFRDYTHDVKFSLGFDTLRPNEAAFIVEGVKDFFVAKALGLNVFTLGGVQHRLHSSVLAALRKNGNSLAILFDTDFAGFSAAHRLAASLNAQNVLTSPPYSPQTVQKNSLSVQICTLPRLQQQTTKDAPKPQENDLADYVVRFGYDDELRAALSVPAPLASVVLEYGGVQIPAQELCITKHCAESPATIRTLERVIDETPRLFLAAPTGAGKTFVMLRHIAMNHHRKSGGRTIFVVPTIAMAEQIEKEYHDLPLISITGSDNALSLLEARSSARIVVCTADSLPKILFPSDNTFRNTEKNFVEKNSVENISAEKNSAKNISVANHSGVKNHVKNQTMISPLQDDHLLLIVDEAHKLFSDYSYRDEAMRGVMNAMRSITEASPNNRVVCISATPNLLLYSAPPHERFAYLHVSAREQSKRSVAFASYQCREQEAANTILREREHGTVVVRINSEAALKTVQTLLLQNGVLPDDIDLITSRRRATSPEYRHITSEHVMKRRIILTTSLLDCGVNIYNTDISAVLLFDEHDPATIVQFVSRFRRVEHLHILLFFHSSSRFSPTALLRNCSRSETHQEQLFPLSYEQMFQSNLFQAEMRAVEYNSSPFTKGKNLHTAVGKKSAFHRFDRSMMFNRERHCWQADLAGIIAGLGELRLSTLRRSELERELCQYGLTIVPREELFADRISAALNADALNADARAEHPLSFISNDDVAALKSRAKERRKYDERLILTMIAEATEIFMEALYQTTESRNVRRAITTLYPTIHGKPQHRCRSEESSRLLLQHADCFSTTLPETFGMRYAELRRQLFTHEDSVRLLERFRDPRAWARFTEHLAMHRRLEVRSMNLHRDILSPHDLNIGEREWEIRNFVANAATVGFIFHSTTTGANDTDTTKRHIPFALHRAEDIAARVNAFTDDTFRLTKQRAGEIVSALFFTEYKRERETKADGSVGFGGYYTFRHTDKEIIRKNLADFLQEAGIDGRAYRERFLVAMQQTAMQQQTQPSLNAPQKKEILAQGILVQ